MKYSRSALRELTLHPTKDKSEQYWRIAARRIFAGAPKIEIVEIVHTGRKLDSEYLKRGDRHPPNNVVVVLASTGGRWGKSRRIYYPL